MGHREVAPACPCPHPCLLLPRRTQPATFGGTPPTTAARPPRRTCPAPRSWYVSPWADPSPVLSPASPNHRETPWKGCPTGCPLLGGTVGTWGRHGARRGAAPTSPPSPLAEPQQLRRRFHRLQCETSPQRGDEPALAWQSVDEVTESSKSSQSRRVAFEKYPRGALTWCKRFFFPLLQLFSLPGSLGMCGVTSFKSYLFQHREFNPKQSFLLQLTTLTH